MTEALPVDVSRRVNLTIHDFMLLNESGAFDLNAKSELIEGIIVAVNAQHSRHARAQRDIFLALDGACRDAGLIVLFELSSELDQHNMPQPDIVVAREIPEDGPLPGANIALVVEIAGSTLDTDLGVKKTIYARAGIPEYWVADLDNEKVHQFWSPDGENYSQRHEIDFGNTIIAATIERVEFVIPGNG